MMMRREINEGSSIPTLWCLLGDSYRLEEKPDFHVGDKLSVKGKELRKIE